MKSMATIMLIAWNISLSNPFVLFHHLLCLTKHFNTGKTSLQRLTMVEKAVTLFPFMTHQANDC
jgi:hypothetical protein